MGIRDRINSLNTADIKDKLKDLPSRLRSLALPLIIGFFLLVLAALGMVYLQKQNEQTNLSLEISQLKTTLSRPVQTITEFEEEYETIKEAFPTGLKEKDIIIEVLSIAESLGFDVSIESSNVSITSEKATTEQVGDNEYGVLNFHVDINSDYERVMDFIREMDSMPTLKTLAVKELSIAKGETSTSASLEFSVYTPGG